MTIKQNNTSPEFSPQGPVKGLHAIIEHAGAISHFDCEQLEQLLTKAALAAGATVLGANFHDFGDGMGNTGVLMLAESHMSVHTWPENNYAAIDIFVCSNVDATNESTNESVNESINKEVSEFVPIEAAIEVLRGADPHGCFNSQIIRRSVPSVSLKLIESIQLKPGKADLDKASCRISEHIPESQ